MLQMGWHERHVLSSIFVLVAVAIFPYGILELQCKRVRVGVQHGWMCAVFRSLRVKGQSTTSFEYFGDVMSAKI
jgi:hypothetical protein